MTYATSRPALPDGYCPVPAGRIASVVTELEMRGPPGHAFPAAPGGWGLEPLRGRALRRYLGLFRAVGERWLWFSRLAMAEEDVAALLDDERIEAFAVTAEGRDVGLLELDHRQAGAVELSFLGLVDGARGRGAGRWLVGEAMRRSFGAGAARLWVHTCSLDDPRAIGFYMSCGFRPCRRSVEVAPDPRLTGVLPRHLRPDVPMLP